MWKTILIVGLVIAILVGGVLTLLTSRSAGTPSAAVLERAKKRARELADAERAEDGKDDR
jgi:hypothetical protein